MLYAKLIGRIALFTCENIAHIEFYLQGLLPKILAIYTIKRIIFKTLTSFVYQIKVTIGHSFCMNIFSLPSSLHEFFFLEFSLA